MKALSAICSYGLLLFLAGTISAQEQPFKIVVNSLNPTSEMSLDRVSKLLLKKSTRWEHGSTVRPVDLLKRSVLRQQLSEAVHGKSVESVTSYWQAQIFSGRASPPPELPSEAEVLSYVRSNRGAIGYVARDTEIGDGVKVVSTSR